MWVVEAFMAFNGGKYLIVWENLGSSPRYANVVLFNFSIFVDMLGRDK